MRRGHGATVDEGARGHDFCWNRLRSCCNRQDDVHIGAGVGARSPAMWFSLEPASYFATIRLWGFLLLCLFLLELVSIFVGTGYSFATSGFSDFLLLWLICWNRAAGMVTMLEPGNGDAGTIGSFCFYQQQLKQQLNHRGASGHGVLRLRAGGQPR
ncbi:uncharacterized protein [Triticum aestivum]|uniref:uncharacterized protein n=1 Tax=Triticum aestivum TaxID=4565 RepID=UPI001D02866B|nr:uncharacterized protein LOC123041160 [Triticum aestivum]